ncbi:MAG: TrkA family potassium uptake protein [Chloroflexi bacterium]|nr:TrkA family potassium uptake protein [Chloroflexota bacterium]
MRVIVVGGGKVGMRLAQLLLSGGHQVTVIEAREEKAPRIRRDLAAWLAQPSPTPPWSVIPGSGTDPTVLEAAGIQQATVVAATTGADETNLVVTSLARFEFGVPRVIARVNDPRNAWMFTPDMGVDVALNQADLMAHLIAEEISLGDMVTLLKLRKGLYSLVEEKVHPTSAAVGRPVGALNLPSECVLAAIIRKGELIIPRSDVVLQPADEVLAVAHQSQLAQFAALLAAK